MSSHTERTRRRSKCSPFKIFNSGQTPTLAPSPHSHPHLQRRGSLAHLRAPSPARSFHPAAHHVKTCLIYGDPWREDWRRGGLCVWVAAREHGIIFNNKNNLVALKYSTSLFLPLVPALFFFFHHSFCLCAEASSACIIPTCVHNDPSQMSLGCCGASTVTCLKQVSILTRPVC